MTYLQAVESLAARPFKSGDFEALAFAGRFAVHGQRVVGWDDFVRLHEEALVVEFEKGAGPALQLAISPDGRRTLSAVTHTTGLGIDLDEQITSLTVIREVLLDLRAAGITYLAQWRHTPTTWKVHILLPYADRYPVYSTDAVRGYQVALTQSVLKGRAIYDPSTTKAAGLVYAMTRRPGEDPPQQELFIGPNAIDMVGLFPPSKQPNEVSQRRVALTRDQATEEANALLQEFGGGTWVDSKGAWDVRCPVDHGADYRSKTYLYPTGTVSCMAGRCQGKPLGWFVSHMPDEAQDRLMAVSTAVLRADLEAAVTPKVSLPDAERVMLTTLRSVRPIECHAAVIQVTTGAGKTRAVAQHLNQYSAPFEGESDTSGLTAVLAVPTNALLREVEGRIAIPHRRQLGVLAVLNEDGSPACKKHEAARQIQDAGGNVHRLMCGHCEYKEDCPARDGTVVGNGALTVTNHALMSTAATMYHGKGRHPLLVWDESPKWVQQSDIENRDLEWLIAEFDREALPNRKAVDVIVDGTLFPERYRAAVRPVLEVLRSTQTLPLGRYAVEDVVRKWGRLPYHRAIVTRALSVLGVKPSQSVWDDVRKAFQDAFRLNTIEASFDSLRSDTKQRVLRAERVLGAVATALGDGALLIRSETHIVLASKTREAVLYQQYGGVVLDATANMTELRALRPDLTTVNLRVEDAGNVERYIVHTNGLSRKALARRPDTLQQVVHHAKRLVRRWGRGQDLDDPKVVVFTYRSKVQEVQAAWPEAKVAYYGNTRGYDSYFQEGYDCFVSIGDPMANLGSLALQWSVLGGQQDEAAFRRYCLASAEAECAQAHGRARDPQNKNGVGGRLHVHYGVRAPTGWDLENTVIEPLLGTGSAS